MNPLNLTLLRQLQAKGVIPPEPSYGQGVVPAGPQVTPQQDAANAARVQQMLAQQNPDDARYGELGVLPRTDGDVSSELSLTVTDPRLNQGRATNIPSLVQGQTGVHQMLTDPKWSPSQQQEQIAIQRAAQRQAAGAYLPSFPTVPQAVHAAQHRSHEKGDEVAYTQQQNQTMDPSVIQAVYGVKPNDAWREATRRK
jgi:hypothetical protein